MPGIKRTSRNGSAMEPSRHSKYIHEHQVPASAEDHTTVLWCRQMEVPANEFHRQSVTHGIDKAGEGLIGMLEGKNLGKAVLEVASL